MILDVQTQNDIEIAKATVNRHVGKAVQNLRNLFDCPLKMMSEIRFRPIGVHPLEDRPLNFVEQVNQTFTYFVALEAAALLLKWHPEAEGFRLAPGAHAPKDSLDVESLRPGIVGAETFAAVSLTSNGKFKRDMAKLMMREETHRYSFFNIPALNQTERRPDLEEIGVHVWSIGLDYQ